MARVPYIQKADAPPEVRAIYEDIEKKFQMPEVVNTIKILAHTPDLMPPVLNFVGRLLGAPGRLGVRLRDLISLRVSRINACHY
jgi:alkylhydroperoxidase family enzyme